MVAREKGKCLDPGVPESASLPLGCILVTLEVENSRDREKSPACTTTVPTVEMRRLRSTWRPSETALRPEPGMFVLGQGLSPTGASPLQAPSGGL